MFSPEYYIHCLTQSDISRYNTLIGGYSTSDKEKVRGLNEFINLHNQKIKDKKNKIQPLKILYKQILSDRETVSFLPQQFSTTDEVYTKIVDFYLSCILDLCVDEKNGCNAFQILAQQFRKIQDNVFNREQIYISHRALSSISKKIFKNPFFIHDALDDYYRTVSVPDYDKKLLLSKTKTNRENLEKELDEFINKQFLSISLIDKACDNYLHKLDGKEETCVSSSVSEYCAHLLEWEKVINNEPKVFAPGKYEEAVYCSIKGELNSQHV